MGAAVLSLYSEREALAAVLTAAGIKTYPDTPDVFNGGGLVQAGNPYVETGQFAGTYTVRHELYLLVEASPTWAKKVDVLVSKALAVLEDTYEVENLSVQTWAVGAGEERLFLGAQLILTSTVNKEEIFNGNN